MRIFPEPSVSGKAEMRDSSAENQLFVQRPYRTFLEEASGQPNAFRVCQKSILSGASKPQVLWQDSWEIGLCWNYMVLALRASVRNRTRYLAPVTRHLKRAAGGSSGLALGRLTLCRALAWPKKMALRWEFLDGYHRCGAVGSQNGNSRL